MLRPEDIEPPFIVGKTEHMGQKVITPVLIVQFGETAIQLHHFNCTVMNFDDEQYDHVETVLDGIKKGLRFDEDMIDLFLEHDYPRLWRPHVDEATLEWLVGVERDGLEEELDGLLDE